jgi:signal transduction histidine kinase
LIRNLLRIRQIPSQDLFQEFTKEKGGRTIIIGIKDDDSDKGVTISIIDRAKGIDREMAPRLFTKFP